MKFLIKVSKGRRSVGVQDHKGGIRMEGHDEAIDFLYRGGQVPGKDHPERSRRRREEAMAET